MRKEQSLWYKIFMLLLAAVLAIGGWLLAQEGFRAIQELRQIERLPTTSIAAAIPGEIKLNARVAADQSTVTSEHFKVKSVYYRYRYEEEETDADGDRYWDTKFIHTDSVNFIVTDDTGSVIVNLNDLADESLDISLPISEQVTSGATRYTEWRIEPNDTLFILGMLDTGSELAQIGFTQPGAYLPILSKLGEAEEKSDLGIAVILMVSGGISLIAFAAFCLTSGLAIHRIIAFLIILSLFVFVPLVHLGTSMLFDDIVNGHQRLEKQTRLALDKINLQISPYSAPLKNFSQLPMAAEKIPQSVGKIVSDIHINAAFAQVSFQHQLATFPNNLIAAIYAIPRETIADTLSIEQRERLDSRLLDYQPASTQGILPLAVIAGGLLLCCGLSWLGFRLIRLKRHIENLPTSKTTGLVFGLSEIKGQTARFDDQPPLVSPLTDSKCFWYHYLVQEKRQRGKETEWFTVEDRQDHQAFYCQDEYGTTKVLPLNAEIISTHKKVETRGSFRYTERTLKLADPVYILGQAKIDRDVGDTLVIRGAHKERPFLITNLTEQAVMLRKANGGMLSLTFAFSTLMFACLFYLGMQGSFSPADYLLAALIAPLYMGFLVLVLHYNDLVFLKQRAARNLSNIDVSLQKRTELIPNLEKIVKQYLAYEHDLLKSLTRLRTQFTSKTDDLDMVAQQLETEQQVLSTVLARAESNPELKAVKLNVRLMNKLVDLENEVALMREGYNDAVNYYNTRIETLPDLFFARMFGFKAMPLFQFEARQFSRVSVNFDSA